MSPSPYHTPDGSVDASASALPRARRQADAEEATPPLLIGGVRHAHDSETALMVPIAAGPDYCTVTLSKTDSQRLIGITHPFEPGAARPGFKSSERRLCLGGHVWRRWDPLQPSNMFGEDYESWETESAASAWLMDASLPLDSRASRQDYAFDFGVPDDFMPRDLLPYFRPRLDALGIEPQFAGPESSCTVYIGSRQSDRRIRIYRRDFKDPALLLDGFPPMLRIELEVRGTMGHALWLRRQVTGSDGLGVACSHIAHLTGYRVAQDADPLPRLHESTDEANAAQMVFQFVQQNASMIDAADRSGLDLAKLARARVASFSRDALHRHSARCTKLLDVDSGTIERAVLGLLGSRQPSPSGLGE